MSLLERQQAREAAEKDKSAAGLQPIPQPPTPGDGNGSTPPPGSLVPAIIRPAEPDRPAMQPAMAPPTRNPAREELLHDIRVRMQGEVIGAFDTLLDGTPTDTRTKIEG